MADDAKQARGEAHGQCSDIGSGSRSMDRNQTCLRCPMTLTAKATGWSLNSKDTISPGMGAVLF